MLTFAKTADGSTISVDQLVSVPRDEHPECLCHGCNGKLTVKLGNFVAHHFAHKPDSDCYAASSGEGARHLAAKLHLERELSRLVEAGGGDLLAIVQCSHCEFTFAPAVLCRVGEHDKVLVERQLSDFVPDVQLCRDGQAIAVFEVLWTHRCDDAKWHRLLNDSHAAVVEFRAESIIDDDAGYRWTPTAPLRALRSIRVVANDLCEACEREQRDDEQRLAEQREREAIALRKKQEDARLALERDERRRVNAEKRRLTQQRAEVAASWARWNRLQRGVLALCDADQLSSDGRRSRHRLLLFRSVLRGQPQSAELIANGVVLRTWPSDVASNMEQLIGEAKAAASEWAKARGAGTWDTHGGLVDPRPRIWAAERERDYDYDDDDDDYDDDWDDLATENELEKEEQRGDIKPESGESRQEPPPPIDYGVDEATVKALKPPFPNLWWLANERRWLRCYRFDSLKDLFAGLANSWTINRWANEGKIRMVGVQATRNGKSVRLADADHVDRFIAWLRKKRSETE